MLSLALRGLFNQIQTEQVLYTSFGLIAIVGVISLALAVYYLRKGREAYVIYQTVEEEEANEKAYVSAYRFLDYGTVASNILMIAMLCCLVIITSPVIENVYLFIFSLVLMFFSFAVANYCVRTIFLIRQYKLSIFSTPKEVLSFLNSYDEGEKQAEMENAYLTLFELNQIILPALYILLFVLSTILQETQLVALLILIVIHLYINIDQLRKTKRYFK
jgi:brp/blh family beta-carotene 15,15'-monooxygenase